MPFFGQRQKTLRQELQARDVDAEFVRLRAEEISLYAHPIADVEQPEDLEVLLWYRVLSNVDLDARASVGQLQEPGFPERTDGEDAAGDSRRDPWYL
jgi:hypothetical protein